MGASNLRRGGIVVAIAAVVTCGLAALTTAGGGTSSQSYERNRDSYTLRGRYRVQVCHTLDEEPNAPTVINHVREISLMDSWAVIRVDLIPPATFILPRESILYIQADE